MAAEKFKTIKAEKAKEADMKKKRRLKPRLPKEAQEVLRHRGGGHGQKKGYIRAEERRKNKVLLKESHPPTPRLRRASKNFALSKEL
jgi:hypothetical protein